MYSFAVKSSKLSLILTSFLVFSSSEISLYVNREVWKADIEYLLKFDSILAMTSPKSNGFVI